MANTNGAFPTTIGADASFKGHLKFEKGACLLGRIEGEISSKGELVVAEGARINAEVQVENIRIEGELKGNLSATNKVHLSESGHVEGDICASRLEVAEGAVLIGQCKIGTNGKDHLKGAVKPTVTGSSTPGKPGVAQTKK
jgi:cytoskeletal protein CcmA (bactofilin family)